MGNHRVLLYFTLFFIIYMIWAQWQMDYAPKPAPGAVGQTTQKNGGAITSEDIPQAVTTEGGQVIARVLKEVTTSSERRKVVTDVLDVEIPYSPP